MANNQSKSLPTDERIRLAIESYQYSQFKSIHQVAAIFDINHQTISNRLHSRQPRYEVAKMSRKLTAAEEIALIQWIISMDDRGMAPTLAYIRTMADLLLASRGGQPTGENFVRKLVNRHDELKARFSRRYDYQRAQCEDPALINEWFTRVAKIKVQYGIVDDDIYNFDETGFQLSASSTAKVLTRADRRGRPMVAQPGNTDWVTIIEAVNCQSWALPAKVIFPGKVYLSSWYECGVPANWKIGVSKKGWTDDDHCFDWLTEIFDPYTRQRAVGQYRLLILDGHSSHVTAAFDQYCRSYSIVVLQMPAYSSHLLQPLDVGCFSPLKSIYSGLVQKKVMAGVNHIDKVDFLELYLQARSLALSTTNIKGGFAGASLHPINLGKVLCKLQNKGLVNSTTATGLVEGTMATGLVEGIAAIGIVESITAIKPVESIIAIGPVNDHTPSLPDSPQPTQTPYNLPALTAYTAQLHRQRLKRNSPVSQAINQLIKGYKVALNSALLLAEENRLLRQEN
jgi:hypothetical protein